LDEAIEAKKIATLPENISQFEKFTNTDYGEICSLDFRKIRYRKAEVYADSEDSEEEPI